MTNDCNKNVKAGFGAANGSVANSIAEYWGNYWCWTCYGKGKVHGRSEAWNMFLYTCPDCGGTGKPQTTKPQQNDPSSATAIHE